MSRFTQPLADGMSIDVSLDASTVEVGPPGGPFESIPISATISITGAPPYDLTMRLDWDEPNSRLVLVSLTFDGSVAVPVRMVHISRVAIAEAAERALEAAVLGAEGWPGIVARHADHHEAVAIDALVYRMSWALAGQRPSADVGLARGLSAASGAKHVRAARQAGLIPATEPGRPGAGSGGR